MSQNDNQSENKPNKKITSRQIVAIVGVVLLVLLYLVTLVVAFVDTSASGRLFGMCLFATIAVPVLVWIYTWMYGRLTGKSTMADLNIGGKDHMTDEEIQDFLIKQATEADGTDTGNKA